MPVKYATRPDDPKAVTQHAGLYKGGKILAVLGGVSANQWKVVYDQIKPDLVIGANGVKMAIPDLPYWMCTEHMSYARKMSRHDEHWRSVWEMFLFDGGEKVRMVNFKNFRFLEKLGMPMEKYIKVKRKGYPKGAVPDTFSLREYSEGFMSGWDSTDPTHIKQQVGTSGAQLLHLAGLLGAAEVHTVGFELTFKDEGKHHFYSYPTYKADHFRFPSNFVMYHGVPTQRLWIEAAEYLQSMMPFFERDGLKWVDHSDGLFKLMGMKCAEEE